jgi:hypothetical protein
MKKLARFERKSSPADSGRAFLASYGAVLAVRVTWAGGGQAPFGWRLGESLVVYLAMAAAGAGIAYYLAVVNRSAERLAAFFAASGLIIQGDWIAQGWLGLYRYHPGLSGDMLVDSTIGGFLADTVFVPGLGLLLLTTMLPGWLGVLVGTTAVTLMEILFVRTGLLTHHGWQTWWTVALFPLFFAAIRWYWRLAVDRGLERGWARVILNAGLASIFCAAASGLLKGTYAISYPVHLFAAEGGNRSFGLFLSFATTCFPLTFWVLAGAGDQRWRRLALALPAEFALQYGLAWMGFTRVHAPWTVWSVALLKLIATVAAYLVAELVERWAVRTRVRIR